MNIHTKKGVSPLIATVLLIVFAIAIASILLSWLGGYTSDTTERARESSDSTITCSGQAVSIIRAYASSTETGTSKNISRVDVQSTGQSAVTIRDVLVSTTGTTAPCDFAPTDTVQVPGNVTSYYRNASTCSVNCSTIDTIRVVTSCGGVSSVVTGNSSIIGC